MYRFPWYLTLVSTNHASSNPGPHDSTIRNRIVFGVSDTRLKERLLCESSDPTLEKSASLCRAAEASKNQLKELHSSETKPVHAVQPKSKQKPSNWFSNLLVGGTTVKFKLDTGAETNVLPLSVYSKLKNKSLLLETSVVLSSYGEFKVKPEGKLNLSCKIQGMEQTLPFFVVAVESSPILGHSAC